MASEEERRTDEGLPLGAALDKNEDPPGTDVKPTLELEPISCVPNGVEGIADGGAIAEDEGEPSVAPGLRCNSEIYDKRWKRMYGENKEG